MNSITHEMLGWFHVASAGQSCLSYDSIKQAVFVLGPLRCNYVKIEHLKEFFGKLEDESCECERLRCCFPWKARSN